MPDNVTVTVGADAKGIEKELDKVNALLAKQQIVIDKLTQNSVRGAKESANEFGKFALKVLGIGSAAAVAKMGLDAVLQQAQKIRDLQDEISTRAQANEKTVFKEFGAFDEGTQAKIRTKMQNVGAATGASQEQVSSILSDLGNNNEKLTDVLAGKFDSIIKLAVTSGADGKQLVDVVKASFVREKNLAPTKKQIEERTELFGREGKDIGEMGKLIAKAPDKMKIEELIALYEAGKSKKGSEGIKQVMSEITSKDSTSKILKKFGIDRETFDQNVLSLRDKEENKRISEGKFGIEKGSISFNESIVDIEKRKEFGNKKITEKQKEGLNETFNETELSNKAGNLVAKSFLKKIGFSEEFSQKGADLYSEDNPYLTDKSRKEYMENYLKTSTQTQKEQNFNTTKNKDWYTPSK